MRISSAISLASLVGATAPLSDTIVSIKSGSDDVDVRHLPQLLVNAGHSFTDRSIVSFLYTADVTTLGYVHSQVVKTSSNTIDSDTLCDFVSTASVKLGLQADCGEDADGESFGHFDSDLHVDDPGAAYQKHLKWMEMGEVWRLALPHVKRKVKVAVLDSGIDWTDPDFAAVKGTLRRKNGEYIHGGWNFFTNSPVLTNVNTHGTKVSKILAAKSNDSFGIAGIAPNVSLVSLQMIDDDKSMPLSKFLAAIDMAIDLEVDIVSMSFGYGLSYYKNSTHQQHQLLNALRAAQENGILLVSSAGNNSGRAADTYPCWYGGPLGICVAYLQDNSTINVLNTFSSWGERVDVAAYGTNIFTGLDANGNLRYFNGTSAAQPIVAGLAAILLSMDVEPSLVKPLMLANVDPVVCEIPDLMPQTIRSGAINALRTVQHAISLLPSRSSRALRGDAALPLHQ
ncbi:hypothetical protein FOZ60_002870 [Perkinsus olseni]|uniref:subtilisin n=3 Tax=Perkinsus olseni TaxID=32597 RepID=A0A7J6NX12_PEROL|nr:hypothetical protein FOZ60_002870 [Perkinsus olseni]